MDIQIVESIKETLKVIIKCRQVNDEVQRLKCHIELFDRKIQAKRNNETYFVDSLDVLYFESVDNRIFLYTADDVMEVKLRLYEVLYFICIAIYRSYSKRQEEFYTQALQEYQKKRSTEIGE